MINVNDYVNDIATLLVTAEFMQLVFAQLHNNNLASSCTLTSTPMLVTTFTLVGVLHHHDQ